MSPLPTAEATIERIASTDVLSVIRQRVSELEIELAAMRVELRYANEARETWRQKAINLKRSRDKWRASAQKRQALLEDRAKPRVARGAVGYATEEELLEATRARWRRASFRYKERQRAREAA